MKKADGEIRHKVRNTTSVYEGRRIKVFRDNVLMPNGREVVRDIVRSAPAAAIVAFTNNGKVLLLRQFRYPLWGWLYELPAGVIEEGESPEECARRELEEETGYRAGKIRKILRFFTSPGFCDEEMHVFLAEDLEKFEARVLPDECLTLEEIALSDAMRMISDGRIADGKTVAALSYYQLHK